MRKAAIIIGAGAVVALALQRAAVAFQKTADDVDYVLDDLPEGATRRLPEDPEVIVPAGWLNEASIEKPVAVPETCSWCGQEWVAIAFGHLACPECDVPAGGFPGVLK